MRASHYQGEPSIVKGNGYVYVYAPDHPRAVCGRVPEHVLVAERALGRFLKDNEVVHHINEIKTDNQNSNLLICTGTYHRWLHGQMRRRLSPSVTCEQCGRPFHVKASRAKRGNVRFCTQGCKTASGFYSTDLRRSA